MSEEIDLYRELAELSLQKLAESRRELRAFHVRLDAATFDARAALAAAGEPFVAEREELTEDEALAQAEAEEAIEAFEEARRRVLFFGRECPRATMPEGVSIKWLEAPKVVDRDAIPEEFWDIDAKKLKAAFNDGLAIPGVGILRKPSIVVAS